MRMGRPPAPIPPEGLEPTFDYLRRAIARGADAFSKPPAAVASSFLDLTKRGSASASDARADVLNKWVERHMTIEGRARMLAALRRRRADVTAGSGSSRTVRLSNPTYVALQSLARGLSMPMAAALDSMVQVALLDQGLREAAQRQRAATVVGRKTKKSSL